MSEATDTTAKLENLAGLTQEADADNPTSEQRQEQAQQAEAVTAAEAGARDWGMLMFTIGGFACMIAPELKPVYSQDRCLTWGMHAHQVSEKYGWSAPGNMPELALAASTIGFAVPTYLMVKAKLAELKTSKEGNWLQKVALWWAHRRGAKRDKAQPGEGVESGGQQ